MKLIICRGNIFQSSAYLKILGDAQESEQRRQSNEVKKSRKSGNRVGGTPNMEAGSGFGSSSLSGKHGEVRKGKPMRRAREKQSEKENKMWWLKLPYVLVGGILLAYESIVLTGFMNNIGFLVLKALFCQF